jgi:hypothetical protein
MFKPVRWVLTVAFLVLMVTHAAVNVGNVVYFGPYVAVLDVFSISRFPLSYFTKLLK